MITKIKAMTLHEIKKVAANTQGTARSVLRKFLFKRVFF